VTVRESTRRSGPIRDRETCRIAVEPAELTAHHLVREAVFVHEQRLFPGSDRDAVDDDPATVHVVGFVDDHPVGSVRLYERDPGEWKGDRLAVLPGRRAGHLGAALVRFAVATARERGGHVMIAYVQQPNETFFRHLGWTRVGEPFDYVGQPHVRMDIALR
jgi:putative N-acetyltransferase (TIGR04045 family)